MRASSGSASHRTSLVTRPLASPRRQTSTVMADPPDRDALAAIRTLASKKTRGTAAT